MIAVHGSHPVQVRDVARVERGPEPAFKAVTAQGRDAVLLNIQSQADGSTLDIAAALKKQLQQLRRELPPDMHLAFYYDQSLFVRDSVSSVHSLSRPTCRSALATASTSSTVCVSAVARRDLGR